MTHFCILAGFEMMRRLSIYCPLLAFILSAVIADRSIANEGSISPRDQIIFPFVSAEPKYEVIINNILSTPAIFGDVQSYLSSNKTSESPNFIFVSKKGAIAENRLQSNAVFMFEADTQDFLKSLNTNTETCYVQELELDKGRELLLAVHNYDDSSFLNEDVFRCVTLAVVIFYTKSTEATAYGDWRDWLISVFNELHLSPESDQ